MSRTNIIDRAIYCQILLGRYKPQRGELRSIYLFQQYREISFQNKFDAGVEYRTTEFDKRNNCHEQI